MPALIEEAARETPATAPETGNAAAGAGSEAPQTPASIDVVRVEPSGSALLAGRGAPDSAIEIRSGDEVVAAARTNASGEFVADFTLPPGEHRLTLGDNAVADTAIVNVPATPKADELLVLAQRPGEATRVLAKPAPVPAPARPPAVDAAAIPPPTADRAAAPAPAGTAPLAVEAVEIEGRQLFVAGAARKGSTVRLYLDDQPVGEAKGGEGDRFVASATLDVEPGDRRIRADQIDAGGDVVARVEVPFDRPEGERMAAVAGPSPDGSAAAAEPAPLQPADARVIIRRGDTLWRISRDLYGRGARYTVIYLANGDQIRDPNRIYPGQVFRTPADEDASRG